jgi:hypothetical protein
MAIVGVNWRRGDNRREPGWTEMRRRLKGINGNALLYFMSSCTESIRTIPTLQHDETDAEDLDTDGEDHAADETRYAMMSRPMTEDSYIPDEPLHLPKRPDEMTINELIALRTQRRQAAEAAA